VAPFEVSFSNTENKFILSFIGKSGICEEKENLTQRGWGIVNINPKLHMAYV
jgi:hypothetical protein